MIKCTDEEAKATEKVLDKDIYHDFIVIGWAYDYNVSYSSTETGLIKIPTVAKKIAIKLICRNCGITKEL